VFSIEILESLGRRIVGLLRKGEALDLELSDTTLASIRSMALSGRKRPVT